MFVTLLQLSYLQVCNFTATMNVKTACRSCEIALTIKTLAMLLAQDSRNTQYRVKHLSHMQPRPQLQHNTTQEPLHLRYI